jgi:exodeoxyribonuclease VII small subunit
MPNTTTDAALSFEAALSQLEKIVAELESGQAPLEKSLELYQKGAELKALCESRLEAARLQVEKISLSKSGAVEGVAPADFS